MSLWYKGSMARTRAMDRAYIKSRRNRPKRDGCVFCNLIKDKSDQIISQHRHCLVIKNLFGYALWDGCGVSEHLMVIPRRHVCGLYELADVEMAQYMRIATKYEKRGYVLYARAPGSATGSVAHQHMHLIKLDDTYKKLLFFVRRPHILWMK